MGPLAARWMVPVLLLVIAAVSYRAGYGFRGPIDEDAKFYEGIGPEGIYTFGLFDLLDTPQRPLQPLIWGLTYKLVGWEFRWYLWLPVLAHGLNAILYWAILRRLLPGERLLAAATSLLFLVHPADGSRAVLTILSPAEAMLGYVAATWMMLALVRKSSVLIWVAMPLSVAAGLLSYEIVLPFTLLTPLLLLGYGRPHLTRRKLLIACVWGLGLALVAAWRLYIGSSVGLHHFGGGRPEISSPWEYIALYAAWARTGILDAWPWTVGDMRWGLALRSPEVRRIPLWFAALVPSALLAAGWLVEPAISVEPVGEQARAVERAGLRYARLAVVGLLLTSPAYILPPLVYKPPLADRLYVSRFHSAAGLGLSLSTVAGLFWLAHVARRILSARLARRLPSSAWLGWSLSAVFVSVAILWQFLQVQYWARIWDETADVWREVMEAAPKIAPDSLVMIVDPPHPAHLRSDYLMTAMVRMLYNDPTLWADMAGNGYPSEVSATAFEEEGVRYSNAYGRVSHGQPVEPLFFRYDEVVLIEFSGPADQTTAQIVECVPSHLLLNQGIEPPCTDLGRVSESTAPGAVAQELLYR